MTERYLLDTNIISELCRAEPDSSVVEFVAGLDRFWLSVITLHELQYGLELLPQGKKRDQLTTSLSVLTNGYSNQIVVVDTEVAKLAGRYRARARLEGKTLHIADSLIAACANKVGDLIVATRNIADFTACPVRCINPFVAKT